MASSILRLLPWKGNVRSSNPMAVPGSSNRISVNILGGRGSRISTTRLISASANCISPATTVLSPTNNVLGVGSDDDDAVSDEESAPSNLASSITSPWLMLPPETTGNMMVFNFYSIAENKVVSININNRSPFYKEKELKLPLNYFGSSHGWLALFKSRRYKPFLYNPLSGRRIDLPPIHNLPVGEIFSDPFITIRKLILSCSPDEQDCIAMMSYNSDERLAFCRPSLDKEWTPIGKSVIELDDKSLPRKYQDFVYSSKQKLFFCITETGNFEAWDLHDPRNLRLIPMVLSADRNNYPWGSAGKSDECIIKRDFAGIKYLVIAEQTDQLFLVRRYVSTREWDCFAGLPKKSIPYMTISFDVHEIDRDRGELRYMESSLNGLTFFIGLNHGFAISSSELKLNPDSIYFTDSKEYTPSYTDVDSVYGGHDIGVFDYVNRDFSPCYYPTEKRTFDMYLRLHPRESGADKIKRIVPPPMWFTPSPPL